MTMSEVHCSGKLLAYPQRSISHCNASTPCSHLRLYIPFSVCRTAIFGPTLTLRTDHPASFERADGRLCGCSNLQPYSSTLNYCLSGVTLPFTPSVTLSITMSSRSITPTEHCRHSWSSVMPCTLMRGSSAVNKWTNIRKGSSFLSTH